MMRTLLAALLSVLLASAAAAEDKPAVVPVEKPAKKAGLTEKEFAAKVREAGGVFEAPEGYVRAEVLKNHDVFYHYALRHPTRHYEVRYILRPVSKALYARYEESAKHPEAGHHMVDPDKWLEGEFTATALNIAGDGKLNDPTSFPPAAVKKEFGADAGLTAAAKGLTSGFAKGFSSCVVIGIHKDKVGRLYVVHLFDDPADYEASWRDTFYSLRFR